MTGWFLPLRTFLQYKRFVLIVIFKYISLEILRLCVFVIKGDICWNAFKGENCSFKAVNYVCHRKLKSPINPAIMNALPVTNSVRIYKVAYKAWAYSSQVTNIIWKPSLSHETYLRKIWSICRRFNIKYNTVLFSP